MGGILSVSSVRDTRLWQRLNQGFESSAHASLARTLAEHVAGLCKEAEDRIRRLPALHPEFTLHDDRHFVRVTELMWLLLGDAASVLNPPEIAILVLSAYFHDQGMVPDASDWTTIEKSDDYRLHAQIWTADHPNLTSIEGQLASSLISAEERQSLIRKHADLLYAMKADFIRKTHGQRSAAIVNDTFGSDPRLAVAGVSVADLLSRLCESHVLHPSEIRPETGFHHDHLVANFRVNLRYLAVILRLADILDFDRERTPDALFRAIHFSSEVSVAEWEKHRAVQGWTINPDLIRFDMYFGHPIYERLARSFLDWIDDELVWATEIIRSFPKPFSDDYSLRVPQRVDRSRVGPKDKRYVYHDLEFTLSRDEIIKLLMTEKLYRSPSLAIRELVQNSLDALRYRRALFAVAGLEWRHGCVQLEHRLDDHGRDVIQCQDNGVGMDELVITKFLTNVGRSFYRSPFFEQERNRLRAHGADFDPCSRFGIGFMSCFMIGDHIEIETRRDYGPGKAHGRPWKVEINGLSGMVVMREGAKEQAVGTTVTIFGREPQLLVDGWSDRIQLVKLVRGYCLAVEFPIMAACHIDKIKETFKVPPEPLEPVTDLERNAVSPILTFQQRFSEIDGRLSGTVRESFLVDQSNLPTIENKAAKWAKRENSLVPIVELADARIIGERHGFDSGQDCLDGILVAGEPGRGAREDVFGTTFPDQMDIVAPFLLDVRGEIKPEITAARTPPNRLDKELSWEKLRQLVRLAHGRIWESVLGLTSQGLSHSEFWKLSAIYNSWLLSMRSSAIWEHLALPVRVDDGETSWVHLHDVSKFGIDGSGDPVAAAGRIMAPEQVQYWQWNSHGASVSWQLKAMLVHMSTLDASADGVKFELRPPTTPSRSPDEYRLPTEFGYGPVIIPYTDVGQLLLSAECSVETANYRHPVVSVAHEHRFTEKKGMFETFAMAATRCFSDKNSLKLIADNINHPSRWMRHVGHRYKSLDWMRIDPRFTPPYHLWTKDAGCVAITDATLRSWAE